MSALIIRPMKLSDIDNVYAMVMRVFIEFIAPLHSQEGIERFSDYAYPASMRARYNNHIALVAEVDGQIVGVAEMRDYRHLSMLFVEASYQGQGISRRLWDTLRTLCLTKHPGIDAFTVNSAPNAVQVYEHYGFVATNTEQIRNSVRFVPMRLAIS